MNPPSPRAPTTRVKAPCDASTRARRGVIVDHPHVDVGRWVVPEDIGEEPLDSLARAVLAVVRIELWSRLVETVPRVDDLEARLVR